MLTNLLDLPYNASTDSSVDEQGGEVATPPPVLIAGLLDVIRKRGGALPDRPARTLAEALQAAFLSIPKACAFLAMEDRGSEPGNLPGDLWSPCASRASARARCALRPAAVPRSGL